MFDPDADGRSFRKRMNIGDEFVVTYAGALGMANDLPTLLRAADLLRHRRDVHFLIVGDGKERSALEAQARELGLTNLNFTGPCPKSEMGDVLAASDACVATLLNIPMFRTTYPNKVFDYMAAGRPTILAIDGVIREVIEAAGGGIFVTPGSAEELAATVARLADDRAGARAMGGAARDYVVQHFNREHHAQQFATLVADISRSPAAPIAVDDERIVGR
jgi:glycosyltransferase involved in cell wall biosynthesis